MAGGELRLGTTSMYMTTYITRFGTSQHINTNLHGYILSDKCKLIAQNQAFERVNRGKFRLEHMPIRLSVARVCKVSFAFAFAYRFKKRGNGFPKPLNGARLCFA